MAVFLNNSRLQEQDGMLIQYADVQLNLLHVLQWWGFGRDVVS